MHSYFCNQAGKGNVIASTHHGVEFPSVVGKNSIVGTQFHPQKSQTIGLKILSNFVNGMVIAKRRIIDAVASNGEMVKGKLQKSPKYRTA